MGFFDFLQKPSPSVSTDDIKKGTLIDVRSPGEFSEGHHELAINIPLPEVNSQLEALRKMKSPIYLCCASGMRSGTAASFLVKNNINALNLGGWKDVPR